jgi:hypothetical protein
MKAGRFATPLFLSLTAGVHSKSGLLIIQYGDKEPWLAAGRPGSLGGTV